jgi:CRP-like cAMP-binding protein
VKKVLFIFGQLVDSDIEWMITFGRTRSARAGEFLIQEGTTLQDIFIVLSGAFSIRAALLGSREVGRATSGEILGEMSFVDSRPTSASVVALADSTVLAIPRAQMSSKLESDTGFAARFYRALALLLSEKVRARSGLLPHGDEAVLDENVTAADEIDSAVLDEVHLAGARFEEMLKRLAPR